MRFKRLCKGVIMAKAPPTEEYIQMYTEYHVLHWSAWEIAKKHECSDDKVWDALRYVDDNIVDLSHRSLLKGAIFAVRERLKRNKEEQEKLRQKSDDTNYAVYIGLNREIRADEQLLYSLTGLLGNGNHQEQDEPITVEMPGLLDELFRKHLEDAKLHGATIEDVIRDLGEKGLKAFGQIRTF